MELNDSNFKRSLTGAKLPVLLFFRAGFCGPSVAVNALLDRLHGEIGEELNIVDVDVETNPIMTREFQVKGTPSLVMVIAGEPKGCQMGTMPYADLLEFVKRTS